MQLSILIIKRVLLEIFYSFFYILVRYTRVQKRIKEICVNSYNNIHYLALSTNNVVKKGIQHEVAFLFRILNKLILINSLLYYLHALGIVDIRAKIILPILNQFYLIFKIPKKRIGRVLFTRNRKRILYTHLLTSF